MNVPKLLAGPEESELSRTALCACILVSFACGCGGIWAEAANIHGHAQRLTSSPAGTAQAWRARVGGM